MSIANTPVLAVADLIKRFGSRVAVAGLSLRVLPGELVALAGPNGSGKSTALRMFAGLLKPDSGSGQVLGGDMRHLDRAARNAIGYLPQRAALYASLPIYENLRFRAAVAGVAQPGTAARSILAALGLSARGHEPLAQLSGGWTRRVEIAATLIHQPLLLLLDEPTTGLDSTAVDGIWEQLDDCRALGAAIIYSSHEATELARASRCMTMPDSAHVR
jgi:ABC-2 type transport system ATP-binding protein